MNKNKKIKVVVVDDSLFMRKLIKNILENDPAIEVIAEADNGEEAVRIIDQFHPDVVTMDYNMPVMNGEEATAKILSEIKIPPAIIMLSASTKEGADITMRCLRAGAVDFLAKPTGEVSYDVYKVKADLISKVKTAVMAKIKRLPEITKHASKEVIKATDDSAINAIIIGSSTGGPPVVENIISQLPRDLNTSIFVIQHMPEEFTKNFAERLDKISAYHVKEAEDNEIVTKGTCYIAKGGWHMKIKPVEDSKSDNNVIYLTKEPKYNSFRPSIDISMKSIVSVYKKNVLGVILTGMGNDGLEGMRAVKEYGGFTIAQSPESSVISSMPYSVIEAGLADHILGIEEIAPRIEDISRQKINN